MRRPHLLLPIALLIIGTYHEMIAQVDDLPEREVQVMKDFRARLGELGTQDLPLPDYERDTATGYLRSYQLSMPRLSLTDERPTAPVEQVEEPVSEIPRYQGYFDAHYGLNHRRRLHAGYTHELSDAAIIDAHVRYDGYQSSQDDWLTSDDLDARLGTGWSWNDWLMRAAIGYAHRDVGYNTDGLPESLLGYDGNYRSPSVSLGAERQLSSLWNLYLQADYQFSYEAYDIGVDVFGSSTTNRNHQASISLDKSDLIDDWVFSWRGRFQTTSFSGSNAFRPQQYNYLTGLAAVYNSDALRLEVGSDVLFGEEDTDLLPTLTADLTLSPRTRLSGGLKSSVTYQTLGDLHRIQPWLNPSAAFGTPLAERRYFVEGAHEVAGVNAVLNVSYVDVRRRAFWIYFFGDVVVRPNSFITSINHADRIQVSLHADRELTDQLVVELDIVYDHVDVDSRVVNLDQRNWLYTARATYKDAWLDGLDLSLSLEGIHGQFNNILADFPTIDRSDPTHYLTMHLRSQYQLNDKISAYIELHNLFDDRTGQYIGTFETYNRLGFSPSLGVVGRF